MLIYKIALCLILGVIIYKKGILDFRGSIVALLMGITVAYLAGLTWLSLLIVFLFVGYLSTKYKYSKKSTLNVAEANRGRRSATNVLANGLVPTLFVVLWYFNNNSAMDPLLRAAYIAAIATVTGDTLSSELGVFSKDGPYLITTFEKVPVGVDGGISPLGELVGITGALVIGISAWLVGLADIRVAMLAAVVGGTMGFHFDSLLGATFERVKLMDNATVNFLSTIVGSVTGLFIVFIFV